MAGNCVNDACAVVASCLDLEGLDNALPSGVYELDPDAEGPADPYMNYCDLETEGGGWTLVLKSNGDSPAFHYNSAEWTTDVPYQPDEYDLDRTEAKLPSWSLVGFTEVLIGMEAPIGGGLDPVSLTTVSIDVMGTSLYDVISPGSYVQTSIGRPAWLSLMQGASLQDNCDKEGFNVTNDDPGDWHNVRIGILGNNEDDCSSTDSRLGIGGTGTACGTLDAATGNFVGCSGSDQNTLSFGAVFVR
jgi:hypothetical protein